jgi:Na+-driven multidrug efflux pump
MKRDIIDTLKAVNALIAETYVYAVLIAIIALAVAYLIARLITWKGGKNDNSHLVRRIWYIIIGLFAPIFFFLYNTLVVSDKITKAPLFAKFSVANIYATLAILVIYILLGIITMMIFRRSKWGSILGR